MRYLRLMIVPLLLVACTETQTPLDQTPQFDFANAPEQTGVVYRGSSTDFGWSFPDFKTGWQVTFGFDVVQYCNGVWDGDELYWADKLLPGDEFRDVSLNKFGEARTAVWPFTDFDCDLFATVAPLASGTSVMLLIDNDWSGSARPNTNTWGWMLHGTLAWTADDSPAQFSFHRRLVWNKDKGTKLVSQVLTLH
ncbi:MAG: hypothetical protein IH616_14310 [Gemmatimonadales bacterium]|nr:hypothetical protein [Gemmatimonadales bacterium]